MDERRSQNPRVVGGGESGQQAAEKQQQAGSSGKSSGIGSEESPSPVQDARQFQTECQDSSGQSCCTVYSDVAAMYSLRGPAGPTFILLMLTSSYRPSHEPRPPCPVSRPAHTAHWHCTAHSPATVVCCISEVTAKCEACPALEFMES